MKNTSMLTLVIAALCAGCGDEGDEYAEEFGPEQGQMPAPAIAYPDEATGYAVGDVIPNLQYSGFADFTNPANGGAPTIVQMGDFYNPDGVAVYDERSPYGAGKPKPKAFVLTASAVWCGPCNYEAEFVLPGKYAQYAPAGQFITALIDGPTPGLPAKQADVYNWASKYQVNYSVTNDPLEQTMEMAEPAFPTNIIVRTSDMRIAFVQAGVAEAAFWSIFEQVIAGTWVIPGAPQ